MGLFNIDIGLAIWTWIVFGITFIILAKFAFPQVMAGIKNREETIARAVDNASQIEKRLADIEEEQAEMIRLSKIQANEILRETRLQAGALREELRQKAEQEAKEILVQARAKIDQERDALIRTVKRDIADFVCEASEKVIGRSFVAEKDRDWVQELVETL